MNDNYVHKLRKKHILSNIKAQTITQARLQACSDWRLAYSQWIMIKSCSEKLNRQNIWNWDATQLVYNSHSHEMVCVPVADDDEEPVTASGAYHVLLDAHVLC